MESFYINKEVVALSYCEVGIINFTVCWNSFMVYRTLNSKNLYIYTESAGNHSDSQNELFRDYTRNISDS